MIIIEQILFIITAYSLFVHFVWVFSCMFGDAVIESWVAGCTPLYVSAAFFQIWYWSYPLFWGVS